MATKELIDKKLREAPKSINLVALVFPIARA